jgi:CRP-like cAMP-binding protein
MSVEVPDSLALLVRKLERLGELDSEDKRQLARLELRIERVPRSRVLVAEGDVPRQCCLLIAGFACRYKEAANGSRQIVSFHLPGDLLDIEHLLLSRADHSVQAITEATVGWVDKGELRRLAWQRTAIGEAMWRDCLIDASIFREWVLNVGRRDAKARVAHLICEFAARCEAAGLGTADGLELPMTQQQIADATGLTPVHVNRTLRALDRERALWARNGNRLRIVDWARLQAIGDFDASYRHAAA